MYPLDNISKLSGPVSCYEFYFQERRYIFFGDEHFTKERNCESTGNNCLDIDLDNFPHARIGISNCYTFPAYLDKKLTYNNINKIKTDLYIERPFRKPLGEHYGIPTNAKVFREKLADKDPKVIEYWTSMDYLRQTQSVLYDCLKVDKQHCPYLPNIRVHYADIRYSTLKEDELTRAGNYSLVMPYVIDRFLAAILIPKIKNYVILLKENTNKENILKLQQEILSHCADFNHILTFIINNIDNLYNIWLSEVDFIDKLKLLQNLISPTAVGQILRDELWLNTLVTSLRDGKRMHKVAIQLRALRLAGNSWLANKIISFIKLQIIPVKAIVLSDLTDFSNVIRKILHPKFPWDKIDNVWNYIQGLASKLRESIVSIYTYLMDAYLLARMFRFSASSEIIIYTGEYHTLTYIKFFQRELSIYPVFAKIGYTIDSVDPTLIKGVAMSQCIENFHW